MLKTKILNPLLFNYPDYLTGFLAQGDLVAIPTETVYGLACNAANDSAVKKIYLVKQRPNRNPLISHYASMEQLSIDASLNKDAMNLANAFWPGPLTLVLKRTANCRISNIATAGLDTVAVRIPNHDIALKLLGKCDFPVAAPSANISGKLSPTSAMHVKKSLNWKIEWILDGGYSDIGIESTIVDCTNNNAIILRCGGITIDSIAQVLGYEPIYDNNNSQNIVKAPGMLYRHYQPYFAKVRIVSLSEMKDNIVDNEALITFGKIDIPIGYRHCRHLSLASDLSEAAKNLFKFLHELDEMRVSRISIMSIPNEGIGISLNEKLNRACI
ncbi:MAG: L-threonylcarbamoyladenylate synthase [Rickettsiaceae bacterium]